MKADQKKKAKETLHKVKSDDELKQLAKDMWAGKIFSDRHIVNLKNQPSMAGSIFMPLVFLDKKQLKVMQEAKVNFMYEYLDKAGPRSINGYPIFMSVNFLSTGETEKMFKYYEQFKKLAAGF